MANNNVYQSPWRLRQAARLTLHPQFIMTKSKGRLTFPKRSQKQVRRTVHRRKATLIKFQQAIERADVIRDWDLNSRFNFEGFRDEEGFINSSTHEMDDEWQEEEDNDAFKDCELLPTYEKLYRRPDESLQRPRHKDNMRRRLQHWDEFVLIITGDLVLHDLRPGQIGHCSCIQWTLWIPALSFNSSLCLVYSLILGCEMMAFSMYSPQCPQSKAMLGFICKGYYPSSLLSPAFAINEDVIIMFYQLNMLGLSSKKTYCGAFRHYLKTKGGPVDTLDCYRAFLGVYST